MINAFSFLVGSSLNSNTAPVISGLTGLNDGYTYTDAENDLENNFPPEVQSLSISGTGGVGNTLTSSFTFYSHSDYSAGAHIYQWYREEQDGSNRVAISGANSSTYTQTSDDQDLQILVGVIAVQTASSPANGNNQSEETFSNAIICPFDLGNIQYFGSASNIADNGSANSTPLTITPPASMESGDLVYVTVQNRFTDGTFGVANTGGQTWTNHGKLAGTLVDAGVFTCTFNGTWSANPQFEKTGFTSLFAFTGVMHVFRPSSGKTWTIDGAFANGTFIAGTTPFIKTLPSQVINNTATISLAGWFSSDDNTWGNLTEGWVTAGSDQYRNLAGSDISSTYAYKIQYEAGSTGAVSKEQLTLGGDGGVWFILTFYES